AMSESHWSTIRLLRTGIVPLSALESLSVGYSRIRSDFTTGLERFLSGSPQLPLFVNGEWGTGKSHFLSYCRMLATRAGVPTAYVSLNARTVPLNYPQRVYSEIAAGVRVGSVVGLRPLLHSLLINSATRLKLRDFSSASGGLLAQSIGNLCHYYEENQVFDPHCELLWSLVLGEDLVWADYTYKRAQALDRIEELSRCFYTVNAGGMILLLDEVETTDQLWNYK